VFAVVLAVLSSVSYGAADFAGAMAAKSTSSTAVTTLVQAVSLITLGAVLILDPPAATRAADLGWGAVGGVGTAVALACFYRALAIGPMSVAAATTALVGALVPLVAGVLFGERPSGVTWLGIAASIPAAVLVSAGGAGHGHLRLATPREQVFMRAQQMFTIQLSVIAGLGFGVFFVALSRTGPESGLYPLVGARAASIAVLMTAIALARSWGGVARSSVGYVVVAGVLDCAANSCYLLALEDGDLTWVSAVVSLYPTTTVLLAGVVVRERISRLQFVGLLLAGVALAMVTIGR
jgi:drug/metabolite transporter (DMT)-like permease